MSRRAALRLVAVVACVATLVDRRCGAMTRAPRADDATAFDEARARATARAIERGGARPCGTTAEARMFAVLDDATARMANAWSATTTRDRDGVRATTTRRTDATTTWTRDGGETTAANLTTTTMKVMNAAAIEGEGYEETVAVVSAHADSAHASAGGSDCAACAAIALETIRALLARIERAIEAKGKDGSASPAMCDARARRCASVVLAFTTAEEDGLAGARGLTASREWRRKGPQVILNLESMGAGGPHRMFQARSDTAVGRRALRAWARVAPLASGGVFGDDVFKSGLINSGTDYEVFRKFTDAEALFDFAFVERTMVYHTPRDRVKFMRPGSFKHSGENLLEFLSHYVSRGGFESEGDDARATKPPPPVSWYTIPGYGMVVHDAPRREMHAVFFAAPLVVFAAFLHKAYVGEIFASSSASAESARARMENTFRLMVSVPFVIAGCAVSWMGAIASAALAPATVAFAFGEPSLYVARPLALGALAGSAACLTFICIQRCTRTLAFAMMPLPVKMKSNDDAERVVEWSLLLGNVAIWGAAASRATRAEIGSSYIPLLWLILPSSTIIAPVLVPWILARGRSSETEAAPPPPPPMNVACAIAAPVWITFPNAALVLRVLQGIGARSPVSDDIVYLHDAIGGAVVGIVVAATCSFLVPGAAAKEDSAPWRRGATISIITLALACAYTAVFMRVNAGVHWTALSPQPLILTHISDASFSRSRVVLARAGASRMRRVVEHLESNPAIARAFTFDCTANATYDFVNTVVKGACVIDAKQTTPGVDALAMEARATGASPPKFTPPRQRHAPNVRSVTMDVGESTRWVLAVDTRCVARVAIKALHDENDDESPEQWVPVEPYAPGGKKRHVLNGVGGLSAPSTYAIWYETRDAATRARYFANDDEAQARACAKGLRARTDYVARTPSVAAVDAALPRWAVPFGKHRIPQWLAFVETHDVLN